METIEYPKKLADHETQQYHYDDFILRRKKDFFCVYSFFHEKRYLPLLMHNHDFYEINVIVEGEGMHYIENGYCPAKQGSVFIIPPNIRHGYFSKNNDLLIYNLDLSKLFMSKYADALSSLEEYSMLFEIEPKLRENFNDVFLLTLNEEELQKIKSEIDGLIACELSAYNGVNVIKEAKALAFIGGLTEIAHKNNTLRKEKKNFSKDYEITVTMIKSIEFIHENYSEKIPLETLAQRSAMSKISYLRYFKKLFNTTPYDYLLKYRIRMAKKLIKNTDKTLSFIANEVGFYDLSHFEHYFAKFEKRTPSEYRKRRLQKGGPQ